MATLNEGMRLFTEYQHHHNLPKYARTATARVTEFIAYCEADGVVNVEDVTPANIRKYLAKTPKKQFPGAWRIRYTAIKTFFNYLVFVGKLRPEDNPMQSTPTSESLTNKRMLSVVEFERLLLSGVPTFSYRGVVVVDISVDNLWIPWTETPCQSSTSLLFSIHTIIVGINLPVFCWIWKAERPGRASTASTTRVRRGCVCDS